MNAYILMRMLESAPGRYDKGIRIISLGRLDEAYDRLASYIRRGQRVLDVGCGTGALTLRAAMRGAKVKGIDVNPGMLEAARRKIAEAGLMDNVELSEKDVAELWDEEPESYDVVTCGLVLSELGDDELSYAPGEIRGLLKPGGLLLVIDIVVPRNPFNRAVNVLVGLPLRAAIYLLTRTTVRPIKSLPKK